MYFVRIMVIVSGIFVADISAMHRLVRISSMRAALPRTAQMLRSTLFNQSCRSLSKSADAAKQIRLYEKNFPLHFVESVTVAKMLLEKGAQVDLQDEDGNTALHTSCNEAIPLLIQHKADIGLKNKRFVELRTVDYDYEAKAVNEMYKKMDALDPNIKSRFMTRGYYDHIYACQWYYDGLTPIMEAVWDPKRLEVFLDTVPRPEVLKQIKSLHVLAAEFEKKESQDILKKYEASK